MNQSTKIFKGILQVLLLTALVLTGCNGGGGSSSPPETQTPPPNTNPGPTDPSPIPPIIGNHSLDKLSLDIATVDGIDSATSNRDAGECTAIALDSTGTVHIVYYSASDNSPMHAHCDPAVLDCKSSTNWTVAKIDDGPAGGKNLGRDINLAVVGDTLHVSYRDIPPEGFTSPSLTDNVGILKYALGQKDINSGQWTWSSVKVDDTIGGNVTDTYIDVDNSGRVHISYHKITLDGSAALAYATCPGSCIPGTWNIVEVDRGPEAGEPSHIVSENGKVHISYYLGGDLKYAFCPDNCSDPNAWTRKVVDPHGSQETGRDNSLAIGPNGSVHITYMDNGNGNNNGNPNDTGAGHAYLKHARCLDDCSVSGEWKSIPVDGFDNVADGADNRASVGRSSQIKITGDSRLHVTYRDMANGELDYATCSLATDCLSASDWKAYWVDSGGVGWDTYLAVESNGTLHISYRDNAKGALKNASGMAPSIQ